MPWFIVLILLLLLLPDLYIWNLFLRGAASWWVGAAHWSLTGFAMAAAALWIAGYHHEWILRSLFFLLLCLSLPKMIFMLCSLAGRIAGGLLPYAAVAGNVLGLLLAATAAVIFCYGYVRGWKRIVVREQTLQFATLPAAFDGYRIVHLSDLHVGTYGGDDRFLQQLVERVEALDPDLILFTGDIVNSSAGELAPHAATLARLRARDGVYAVLGNHDYCEYMRHDTPNGAARNLAELKRTEREMGWQLLLDEHRLLQHNGGQIALIGVENVGRPPFPKRGDLQRACEGIPEGTFRILLSHDPSHWRREVLPTTGIELTLSGHTHAMQFRLGSFSPAAWSYGEWGGLYREGGRMLFVSTGTGGTIPFRFGVWPQIDLLTLRRAPENITDHLQKLVER